MGLLYREVTVEVTTTVVAVGETGGGCPGCGNLCSCTCDIVRDHVLGCRYRRAACLSVEVACDHGLQACPVCDPCTCGAVERGVVLRPVR